MSEQSVAVRRLVVVAVLAVAVGAVSIVILGRVSSGFHGILARILDSGGDDTQPPIIVRDGSVIFEGGDALNPKKGQDTWVQLDSAQHWKAVKNNGHHVASFTAYIAGVVDPANCPQTTMAGDAVEIDYNTGSILPPNMLSFHVVHTDDGGGHHSPQVNADDKSGLTAVTTSTGASAPPQLQAGVSGQGWISKVVVTDSTVSPSVTITCALPQPQLPADRSLVRVTITPERK